MVNELTKAGITLLTDDDLWALKTRLLEDMSTEPERGRYNYLHELHHEVNVQIQQRSNEP